MKTHKRIDTIKVFDKEASIIDKMMKEDNISNKSDAYRIALELYAENKEKDISYKRLENEVKILSEKFEELEFFLRAKLK